MPPEPASPGDGAGPRLHVMTGKGGTGKTTLAAAARSRWLPEAGAP